MRYLKKELLKKHTSFRIGGPAEYLCVPHDLAELKSALIFAKEKHLPITIIGAGTNLLALDKGFNGLAIKLAGGLLATEFKGRRVTVGSGVYLPRLLHLLTRKGLSGLEFLVGIPGTVGGAVVMNAGAWGKEIGDLVRAVTVIDGGGNQRILSIKELRFGYRRSSLHSGKHLVVSVVFVLKKDLPRKIKCRLAKYLIKRKEHQPLGIPNAGCIFKNPGRSSAGRLLDQAGCKGMRIGDAAVSSKHANFIVNLGEATSHDVIRLMTKMQRAVKVKLEPEVRLVVKSPI